MRALKSIAVPGLIATLLAGCSALDALAPTLVGERGGGQPVEAAPPPGPRPAVQIQPIALPAGAPSSTFVGQRAEQLRGDTVRLQTLLGEQSGALQEIRRNSLGAGQRYFQLVAGINGRLQIGTTPGNPILTRQWAEAQGELDRIGDDVNRLNTLSGQISSTASFASFLLEAVRATFGLTGAVDEDHRLLALIQDEVNRTVVGIERLLNEVSDDLQRQTAYVSNERRTLNTLAVAVKNGELLGGTLANRTSAGFGGGSLGGGLGGGSLSAPSAAPSSTFLGSGPTALGGRRPLVVIRFDRPNPPYQQQLFDAVAQTLDRQPAARFDLVAVAPTRGAQGQGPLSSTAARRNAETVLRTLSDMGLPVDRVTLTASTSAQADSNEVHLFVR
ncbi:MAG: hypothetical protein EAZ99_19150 [Alphaproteobacteria bacterium]|nr:MAG: hypothetical protein EAZ99_19150 [Alphaproteobacteria bacterium]